MRKTRALVAVAFVLLATPMLMGATITMPTVTPAKGSLSGNGIWSVDAKAGETYYAIEFRSYVKGTQNIIGGAGAPVGGNWSATVSPIAASTYNPTKAKLYYADARVIIQTVLAPSNTTDQVVN